MKATTSSATNLATSTVNDVFPEGGKLKPSAIVAQLDRHVIGQQEAKRAVAIALRNRWRRMQLDESLRMEVVPKNILMVGPTGVGKTEIARRLARLAGAPFIKVDATHFTEVGYMGRDVDSIIRDLVDVSVKMTREHAMADVEAQAEVMAVAKVLEALFEEAFPAETPEVPTQDPTASSEGAEQGASDAPSAQDRDAWMREHEELLRSGALDDRMVEMDLPVAAVGVEIMAPPGMEEMTHQLQHMLQNMVSGKTKRRKLSVRDALDQLIEEESEKLVSEDDLVSFALERVEQHAIVFLDEIDKVIKVGHQQSSGGDVSREGVQRDLLPLIEGCTVNTRYGPVKTDHILFVASGAFLGVKPSDMISELQGRLPIRVELNSLTVEDFARILTEPDASLTKQYQALLKVDGVDITFTDEGVQRLAHVAFDVNERSINIGARRLHTMMEKLLETVAYAAGETGESSVRVDAAYVNDQLRDLVNDEDLTKWVL